MGSPDSSCPPLSNGCLSWCNRQSDLVGASAGRIRGRKSGLCPASPIRYCSLVPVPWSRGPMSRGDHRSRRKFSSTCPRLSAVLFWWTWAVSILFGSLGIWKCCRALDAQLRCECSRSYPVASRSLDRTCRAPAGTQLRLICRWCLPAMTCRSSILCFGLLDALTPHRTLPVFCVGSVPLVFLVGRQILW